MIAGAFSVRIIRHIDESRKGKTMTTNVRADLVTTRETIRRVVAGGEADLEAAMAMLDRSLKTLCPHGSGAWITPRETPDEGRWTMCPRCNVAWREQDA